MMRVVVDGGAVSSLTVGHIAPFYAKKIPFLFWKILTINQLPTQLKVTVNFDDEQRYL